MPLLLNVLRNAEGQSFQRLRVKAMECAGLIGELKRHAFLEYKYYKPPSSYCSWAGRISARLKIPH